MKPTEKLIDFPVRWYVLVLFWGEWVIQTRCRTFTEAAESLEYWRERSLWSYKIKAAE